MSVQERIESAMQDVFSPLHLVVQNESHKHSGPATDSHFRVQVVSAAFAGMNRVARHRAVNKAAQAFFDAGLHALAVEAQSPEEWERQQRPAPAKSPPCAGAPK